MEELGLASGQKRPHSRAIREPLTSRDNILPVIIETRRWSHPERLHVAASVGGISIHCANSQTLSVLYMPAFGPLAPATSSRNSRILRRLTAPS
jgi:hypothetical protein